MAARWGCWGVVAAWLFLGCSETTRSVDPAPADAGLDASRLPEAGGGTERESGTEGGRVVTDAARGVEAGALPDTGKDALAAEAGSPEGGLDGSGSAEVLAIDAFAAAAYAATCDWLGRCNPYMRCDEFYYAVDFRKGWQAARDAAALGKLVLDRAAAAACLAAFPSLDCRRPDLFGSLETKDGYATDKGQLTAPTCRNLVRGLLPPGSACAPDLPLGEECREGYCGGTGCPGVCGPFLPLGAECVRGRQCGPDAACLVDDDAGTHHCVPRRPEGGACFFTTDCQEGFLCTSSYPLGECARPAREGDPCVAHQQCEGALACDQGTCVATSGIGGSCYISSNCRNGQECIDSSCADAKIPGGPSAPCRWDSECGSGLVCLDSFTSGHCDAPRPPGGPCHASYECEAGSFCHLPTCERRAALGAACNVEYSGESCESGLRCMGNAKCSPPGKSSEPCLFGDRESCEAGLSCFGQDETCLGPAEPGELCDPFGAGCTVGLACLCGGATCTSFDYPPTPGSSACVQGTKPLGATCDSSLECLSMNCGRRHCIPAGAEYLPDDPACIGTGPLLEPIPGR